MRRALILCMMLSACASPSPQFFGAAEQRVVIDGTEIAVFQRGPVAQAIRLGAPNWRDAALMRARLFRAVEQATGCAPVVGSDDPAQGVRNDPGVLTVRIAC